MSLGKGSWHICIYYIFIFIYLFTYLYLYLYLYIYIYMYIVRSTFRPFHHAGRVLNRNTTFRQEGVPDTSLGKGSKHAFRWGSDMLSGRGSWRAVWKMFLTPVRKGHDMPLGKGFWHVVRNGFRTRCQKGVPDMLSSRRGSWHAVRKKFLTCCQERIFW